MQRNDELTQGNHAQSSLQRQESDRLPMAEIGMVNRNAQIRGTMLGIAGGLICGKSL
jgi:hypothetical protein